MKISLPLYNLLRVILNNLFESVGRLVDKYNFINRSGNLSALLNQAIARDLEARQEILMSRLHFLNVTFKTKTHDLMTLLWTLSCNNINIGYLLLVISPLNRS